MAGNALQAQASVRPGALTELLAELARAPEPAAGWDVPLLPGDVVGRFEIVREIGRGGFGVVYEARDRELARSVAFKAVRPAGRADPLREARTLGEAEAAARLAHPNIVHLYDVGRCEQGPYLIMELLRGETLDERLARGKLPLREAVRVAVEVSRGLAHAHAQGVVHRDLKPGNVFVCQDGQVKVLDFGLAHVFGRVGVAGGTPAYMAPEQERGELGDERSDVYSLGVMLHELVAGERPGSVGASEEAGRALAARGGSALARLVRRMLAHDPELRPRDGREASAALVAIQKSLEPRWRFLAAWSVAAVAFVTAAAFALRARPLPPGRLLVAMADTENATGDPDLDGISELLGMNLEQSKRVSLMARSRIVNALREAGSAIPRVIGEADARSAGRRAQAQVLVLPAVRHTGSAYEVAVRAVDLARNEPLFALREPAAAKATVPAALDRVTARLRRALREDPRDAPKAAVSAAELAPARPEALRLYIDGERLFSESRAEEAHEAFRAAVAADPGFLLARVALLELSAKQLLDLTDREREEHVSVVRRNLHRLPEKERSWAEVLLDVNAGASLSEWLAALDRAIEAWPEDPRPYAMASGILLDLRGDLEAARPYVEKALVVSPLGDASFIDQLVTLGKLDDALVAARRWTSEHPSSIAFMNLSEVHRERGELREALEAARRGGNPRTFIDADLLEEGEARLLALPGDQGPQGRGYTGWVRWLTMRGRVAEAIAAFDRSAPPDPGDFWRSFVAATRDGPEAIWRGFEEGFRAGRLPSGCWMWPLALAGDPKRAETMAPTQFSDRHVCPRIVEAIARWKRGDRDGALGILGGIHFAASYLYRGEILWELGRDREALESIRTYRRRRGQCDWDIHFDPWHYPRSLYVEALALERLGEKEAALTAANRLMHLWERADADLPLLREAKALQARLVTAQRVGKRAP